MNITMRSYWVTVRIDPTRTADHRIVARSPWAASWLYQQLHPGRDVLMVREIHHGQ